MNTIVKVFNLLKTSDGQAAIMSGFRSTGITDVVSGAREDIVTSLDLYM